MFERRRNKNRKQKKNYIIDIEITKQELSHYPHHVLCRALLGACRVINAIDPEKKFITDDEFHSEIKNKEISCLALVMTDNIMNIYIDNKEEIDKALNMELH